MDPEFSLPFKFLFWTDVYQIPSLYSIKSQNDELLLLWKEAIVPYIKMLP
jgi:hypothetical protein